VFEIKQNNTKQRKKSYGHNSPKKKEKQVAPLFVPHEKGIRHALFGFSLFGFQRRVF
jgi:hypothetical protein